MARLLHLRELMFKEHSQLFAYIVPTDDAHQVSSRLASSGYTGRLSNSINNEYSSKIPYYRGM